jgi:hypothetical protein
MKTNRSLRKDSSKKQSGQAEESLPALIVFSLGKKQVASGSV